MGGSLGAKAINDLAMVTAKRLLNQGKKIIHLTGKNDYERVREFYQASNLDVDCIDFDRNIDLLLIQSDFAISRSGASSLFEIYANALPALFVPYPHAASDHQYHNAMSLVDRGLAYCRREDILTPEFLFELLEKDHRDISERLFETFSPEGASCITSFLKE